MRIEKSGYHICYLICHAILSVEKHCLWGCFKQIIYIHKYTKVPMLPSSTISQAAGY